METFIDRSKYQDVINEFEGAYLQLWYFGLSLKRLVIRLSWLDSERVLFIVSGGTDYIQGKTAWHGATLKISNSINEYDEIVTCLKDVSAGFELLSSGGIAMRYGTKDEDLTFD